MILDKLRSKVRFSKGQHVRTSLGILDSQSMRWGNNRSFKAYDGNKKVKGIKHHVGVDKNAFLLRIIVAVANLHDGNAVMLLMLVLKKSFHSIKVPLANRKYRGRITLMR